MGMPGRLQCPHCTHLRSLPLRLRPSPPPLCRSTTIGSRCNACVWGMRACRLVQCAMYAARSVGFTAVPVIHGIEAVLTMATFLHSSHDTRLVAVCSKAVWHVPHTQCLVL